PCLPDSKKSSRHAARRCASTPTSRDTSSKDSPRNSRNTTSILRFADHLGFDRKSPASSLDTDMSTMLAPLYRLSNDSGCGGTGSRAGGPASSRNRAYYSSRQATLAGDTSTYHSAV